MIADIKQRALHRAKILQGQLRGLEKKIENEDYCMDIITQSLAIQKSLGSLNKLIIENHLKTHIKEKFVSGEDKQSAEAIGELLDLYELAHVRGNS
jgi:DNA-binding FrmR family transcriptional regulator